MKNLYLLVVLFCLGNILDASAQNEIKEYCATDVLHFKQLENSQTYKRKWEAQAATWQKKGGSYIPYYKRSVNGRIDPGTPAILNVVFHDMTGSTNPPTSNYLTIVAALNDIYRGDALSGLQYQYNTLPSKQNGIDTHLQFCLAAKDINGDPYPLLQSRHQSSLPSISSSDMDQIQTIVNESGSSARFPTTKYINIYIVDNISGNTAGFAFLPSAHGITQDGIYIQRDYLSDMDPNGTNLNYNMNVLAHEMGHYLGLQHIFGICSPSILTTPYPVECSCDDGDCYFNGDAVCDTPPSRMVLQNTPCTAILNTCSPNQTLPGGPFPDLDDAKNNYMDYGNWLCEDRFSDGQIARMHWFIDIATGVRKSLLGANACEACPMLENCEFTISGSTIVQVGNVSTYSVSSNPNCTANVTYTWNLIELSTGDTVGNGVGATFSTNINLADGNYQLIVKAVATVNCFEDVRFNFTVLPAAGNCNLQLPDSSADWGSFKRVSYQGGWIRQNSQPYNFLHSTTIRSTETESNFDTQGFEIVNPGNFNDPNFPNTNYQVPTGVSKILRVGRIVTPTSENFEGSAYYVSVKFPISRNNCKYRIYSLGLREANGSTGAQHTDFNIHYTGQTNEAAFGFVSQERFSNPVSNNTETTIGMSEHGNLLQTSTANWAFSAKFGLNDMVSERHNNPTSNFVTITGGYRKMANWTSQDLDFSEFADLTTEVTITFFAHSNKEAQSIFSAYSYFAIECLGSGVPADLQFDIPDLSISCKVAGSSCVSYPLAKPKYALNCTDNTTIESVGVLFGADPFSKVQILRYTPQGLVNVTNNMDIVYSCQPSYKLGFCLTDANNPFEDFQVIYTTFNKTITQDVRVFRGFYYQSSPCPSQQFAGGVVDSNFHPNKYQIWCPGMALPVIHMTDPCFTPNSYLWGFMNGLNFIPLELANSQPPTFITSPNLNLQDVNPSILDRCSRLFVRMAIGPDPFCGTSQSYPSEVFTFYNYGGFRFTSAPTVNDLCQNAASSGVSVYVNSLSISIPQCIPDTIPGPNGTPITFLDTTNSEVELQLLTSGGTPLTSSLIVPMGSFNLPSPNSTGFTIPISSPIILAFDNNTLSTPFGLGSHNLSLKITTRIGGCQFVRIIENYVTFRIKEAARGGQIEVSNANCSSNTIDISSVNDGFSGTGQYAWEVSSSPNGPWSPLNGAGSSPSISSYLISGHYYIRRMSFQNSSCPGDAYSNIVEVNISPNIITPTFNFPTTICSNAGAPTFPPQSFNGVTGTWSPTVISTTVPQTYCFTPNANQCASQTCITTTIVTSITAAFNLNPSYCDNALPLLPQTSPGGVTGIWSPSTVTVTGDYTFTPAAGQCSNSVVYHIEVIPFSNPIFSFPTTYCVGETPPPLPSSSNGGILGSWSPSAINTSIAGTFPYTFIASQNGSCTFAVVSITVNPLVVPIFSFATVLCENAAAPVLPSVSDTDNIPGTWSPTVVNPNQSETYVFTPSISCATPVSIDVVVTNLCTPYLTGSFIGCEEGNNAPIKLDSDIVNGPCLRVCENSTINYTLAGVNPGLITFTEWNITGGTLLPGWTNTQASVTWSSASNAFLQIVIHYSNDIVKTYNLCVEKIAAPTALFTTIPDLTNTNVRACAGSPVNFVNLSTSNAGNGTLYCNWEFGDGGTSTEWNPEHIYATIGNYTATLVVFNGCSCVGRYELLIQVEKPNLTIQCPGVICENEVGHYNLEAAPNSAPCNYQWIAVGGSISQPGQSSTFVDVLWDNVDENGFGYLSVGGENCSRCWATIKVPVIQQNGTIKGDTKICAKSQYKYTLPQWPTTDFQWSLIDNGTGASLIQTIQRNEIIVKASTNGTIVLNCVYHNTLLGCSGSATLTITVKPYASLSDPGEICENTTTTFSFTDDAGNVLHDVPFTVTGPNNYLLAGITGTGSDFSISFPIAGVYTFIVETSDYCYTRHDVTVKEAIEAPVLNGPTVVCPGIPVTYSVPPVSGAVTHWLVQNGTVAGGISTGNAISVNFIAGMAPYSVSVWYEGEQCSSAVLMTTVIKDEPNITFIGSQTVCGSTFSTYTVNDVNAELYNWIVNPPGAGSVQSGQGTISAVILWNQPLAGGQQPTVELQVKKCSETTTFNYPVTVISAPALVLNTPATICTTENLPLNFTLTPSSAWTSITIDYGDSSNINTYSYSEYLALGPYQYSQPAGPSTTYTITVTITGAGGCLSPSVATKEIVVSPSPIVILTPIVRYNLCYPLGGVPAPNNIYSVTIQGGTNGTETIQWYRVSTPNDILVNTTTTTPSSFNALAIGIVGTYYALVTNLEGCTKRTPTFQIVDECPSEGCQGQSPEGHITMNDCGRVKATITSLPAGADINATNWVIQNVNGQIVSQPGTQDFDLSNIPPGSYILNLQTTIYGDTPCGVVQHIPFIIPYKADLAYHITCGGSSNYNIELYDHSVFYPLTPITFYEFLVNGVWTDGVPNTAGINSLPSFTLNPGDHQVGIRIKRTGNPTDPNDPSYPECVKMVTLSLPGMPDASFTYDIACPGTATHLMSVPQAGCQYSWYFQHDDSYNLQSQPFKTFPKSGTEVFLTVTNQYGCPTTIHQPVNIETVNMAGSIQVSPAVACQGVPVQLTYQSSALFDIPDEVKWFKNMVTDIPVFVSSPYSVPYNVTESGYYFAYGIDGNGCKFRVVNGVTVQYIPSPDAPNIQGPETICEGDVATLSIPADTSLNYSWTLDGNIIIEWNNWTTIPAQLIGVGDHVFTVTATTPGSGGNACAGETSTFTVSVNELPKEPNISFQVESCNPYLVQLIVSNPQDGAVYYWSNGESGASTSMSHDGPIQVTSVIGDCSTSSQIDLPLDLNSIAWIFPTGCYSYCSQQTPGYLIGPFGEDYNEYQWTINSQIAQQGAGSVDNFYGLGNGSNDYALYLETKDCSTTLETLTVTIDEECSQCDVAWDIKDVKVDVDINGQCFYRFQFTFQNNNGVQFTGLISAPNGEGTFIGNISISPFSGAITIFMDFYPSATFMGGNIVVQLQGYTDYGDCYQQLQVLLDPPCGTPRGGKIYTTATVGELFVIAPNPARDTSTLYYEFSDATAAHTIEIHDPLGRLLMEFKPDALGQTVIDCSRYAEGAYFILLKKDGNLTKKLKFVVRKN